MEQYLVEFSLTVSVYAEDSVQAVEQAKELANINDASIYVDGNMMS